MSDRGTILVGVAALPCTRQVGVKRFTAACMACGSEVVRVDAAARGGRVGLSEPAAPKIAEGVDARVGNLAAPRRGHGVGVVASLRGPVCPLPCPIGPAARRQCASAGSGFGVMLRMRGTSSVATAKATMMALNASAKASVCASR